ncbi:MAG: SMP-30/gluconolactonase/LRE family protein [Xanthobacteraceae bacterium]
MIAALRDFTDRVFGRGSAAITVPPFDGALKPNQMLEGAEIVAEFAQPNDLASHGNDLYLADGVAVLRYTAGAMQVVAHFDREVTALCALPDGRLAVALDGKEVRVFSAATGPADSDVVIGGGMTAVNALAAAPSGSLLATDGSTSYPTTQWAHDLMSHGRSGRVLSIDLPLKQVQVLASGLRYAFGVAVSRDGAIVSESWRHRLLMIGAKGAGRSPLDNLPVYPSRLCPAAGGGFWLTAFTGRTQLVEFVLRENGYRRRMMQEIDPEFWVAPRLNSGNSFREPMQGAHLKTMGVVKPWAPPRSYGLVIRLSPDCVPRYSLHSRVDGHNHGVVAAVEVSDALYVLAKGAGRLLRLPLKDIEAEFGT